MKITVLIENSALDGFRCEHGLSLYIEYKGKKILLDAGQTGDFSQNAEKSGVDLSDVDIAVLSHGHYDHSGGFFRFFEKNDHAPVYAREDAIGKYFSDRGGMHEIGMPEKIYEYLGRFVFTENDPEISEGVHLIGHRRSYADVAELAGLFKERGSDKVPDDFFHEQSLVFDTDRGLVIFNSCSHAGAENIISEAKEHLRRDKVYAYIGGLHIKDTDAAGNEICGFSDERINDLCNYFINADVSVIYTGHCTGAIGFQKLSDRLGGRLHKMPSGLTFEV